LVGCAVWVLEEERVSCVMEDLQLRVGDAVGKHVSVCDWHVDVFAAVDYERDLVDGWQP
jgi:hypothetical protein